MRNEILTDFFTGLRDYFSAELVSSDERRDCYIDFVSGLAVLSLIYIHTVFWSGQSYIPNWWWSTALLFDVPVFFLLAGMSIGRSRKCSISSTIFTWSISFTLLVVIGDIISGNWNLSHLLSAFFLVSGKSNVFPGVTSSYWFVRTFIFALIFAAVFIRYYDKNILTIGAGLLALYPLAQCGLIDRNSCSTVYSFACYIAFILLGYWLMTNNVLDNARKKILVCAALGSIAILFILISFITIGVGPSLDLQRNKFPVNVSYIGFSLISMILITACYSVKFRLPKFICKIGRDAVWFFAGQCVGSSLLFKIAPLIHSHWSIKLVIAFLCNFVLTFVSVIVLQTVYNFLRASCDLFSLPQTSDGKPVSGRQVTCDINTVRLSVMLVVCLVAGCVFVHLWNPAITIRGESRHYISSTYTLLNSGRISFTRQDIESVERIFGLKKRLHDNYPRYRPSDQSLLHKLATEDAKSPDFAGRSFYWGTYSFLCIPAYLFCRRFHIFESNMFNAFKWTNILMLLVPLLAIVFLLKGTAQLKYLMLGAFAFPAAAQYINWASAECCIYMFVVLCLIFLHNRQYCWSSLCLSLAATLNYCLAPLALVILFCFLRDHRADFSFKPFRIQKTFIAKLLLLGCCYLPVLHAAFWTWLQYSHIATMQNMATTDYFWGRFFAYLFDLNLGIWIYHPILFTVFLLSIVVIVWKREWVLGALWLAFFGIVMGYSLMVHIQCGMEGISRYAVWSVPVAVYVAVCILDRYVKFSSPIRIIFISAVFSGMILIRPFYGGEYHWTTPARFVLDHCSSWYNPFYRIFAFRTTQKYSGTQILQPVVYYHGKCGKILATKEQLTHLWDHLQDYEFNDAARRETDKQREKLLKRDRKYYYLNLSQSCQILPKAWINQFMLPQIFSVETLHIGGAAERQKDVFILSCDGIQFGPYITLPFGQYHVRITGENLDKLLFYCTSNKGEKQHRLRNRKCTATEMEYDVHFRKTVNDVEFVTRNLQPEPGKISTITLIRQ